MKHLLPILTLFPYGRRREGFRLVPPIYAGFAGYRETDFSVQCNRYDQR